MANLLMTREEWERVQAYDEWTRMEIEALEAAQHPPTPPDTMKELRNDLEESRLECLRELQEDIAVLIRVRECWPSIPEIQAQVFNLITLNRLKIDELREEIENAGS
jgi:hypothetical protein